jgi:hypothetical protein|tara:strand:- start:108713 stop:108817 length:105 start_codon:yes stop_codon:yes gene_type:complete
VKKIFKWLFALLKAQETEEDFRKLEFRKVRPKGL